MSSILTSWHDPETKHILHMEFQEGWTWTDYTTVHEPEFEVIRQMHHPVVIIQTAITPRASRPPAGNGFAVIRAMVERTPPEVLGVYVVNANMFVAEIIKIFGRLNSRRGLEIRGMPTYEAAVKLAQQRVAEKLKTISPT